MAREQSHTSMASHAPMVPCSYAPMLVPSSQGLMIPPQRRDPPGQAQPCEVSLEITKDSAAGSLWGADYKQQPPNWKDTGLPMHSLYLAARAPVDIQLAKELREGAALLRRSNLQIPSGSCGAALSFHIRFLCIEFLWRD